MRELDWMGDGGGCCSPSESVEASIEVWEMGEATSLRLVRDVDDLALLADLTEAASAFS